MLPPERLEALEHDVDRALDGDEGALEILGYGEVSSVLAVDRRVACKRLPPFSSRARADAFAAVFARYLEALGRAGVPTLPSELARFERGDGQHVVYCLQPIVDAAALAPRRLAAAGEAEAEAMFDELVARVTGAVGPRLGIDGQLSNWVWLDGRATLLDVSTPFLRDEHGREALDTEIYIEALPWVMRGFVRRFLLGSLFEKYYDPRGVLLDLLGNLYKERLDRLVPALVRRANLGLARPITPDEPGRFYRADRRTWAMLQAARRADRAWQRRVRRRPYPYLLPGPIAR